MTDLLAPRYKVISVYPFNNHFLLNEVITLNEFDSRSHLALQEHYVIQQPLSSAGNTHPVSMYESTFNQYPHLFKKLEWHNERRIDELPQHVKMITDRYGSIPKRLMGDVLKVQWEQTASGWLASDGNGFISPYDVEPITETEYLTYIKSKQ